MKRCPACQLTYADDELKFCRHDGASLVIESPSSDSDSTLMLTEPNESHESLTKPVETQPPSIAVLPFVNMSADPENEYFCDGLAEELLNALAKVEGLKVAARTSSFSFKGKNVDVREIGHRLSVGTILEGSVRKAGTLIRVVAQLVNAADGYHIWSERYDRSLDDVFKIQDELSLAIVDGLKITLPAANRNALLNRYADSTEAYQLYLRGRYHQNKWTPDGVRKSVEHFNRAIEIDADCALAYAGLADSYASLGAAKAFGLPVTETAPRARAAALRALEIDSTLAEAHSSLALVNLNFEWDWEGAEKEFRLALELNPNYANAYHWYSHYLVAMGRMDESLAASRRALELNPLDLETNIHLAWHYYFARDFDRVIEVAQQTLEMDSAFSEAYWFIGWAEEQQGRYDEAIAAYERSLALQERPEILAWLGHAFARSGDTVEAKKLLNRLEDDSNQKRVSAYWPAIIHLGLMENDKAFECLRSACDERNSWMVYLNVNPIFDGLRSDVRFAELLRRVGFDAD